MSTPLRSTREVMEQKVGAMTGEFYNYKPLSQPSEIRLLRLKVPYWNLAEIEGIEAEIEHFTLGADAVPLCRPISNGEGESESLVPRPAPPYTALSYRWGDPNDHLGVLLCDDTFIAVSRNLFRALVQYLSTVNNPRPEWLWVDALCINQKDNKEKAEQVLLMGEIYSRSEEVLACVSGATNKTSTELFVGTIMAKLLSKLDSWKKEQRAELGVEEEEDEYLQAHATIFDDVLDEGECAVLSDFFDCEYWERAWIVQELGLGTTVHVIFEDELLSWDVIVNFCWLMLRHAGTYCHINFLSGISQVFNIAGSFAKPTDDDEDPTQGDFLDVMIATRDAKATVPHDHIFAFLGHHTAKVEGEPIIIPDYNKPLRDVLFEFSRNMIQRVGLRVITTVHSSSTDDGEITDLGHTDLPSWVTRWDLPDTHFSIGGRSDGQDQRDPARYFKIEGEELICVAHGADKISHMSEVYSLVDEIGETSEDCKVDWFGQLLRDLVSWPFGEHVLSGGQVSDRQTQLLVTLTGDMTNLSRVSYIGRSMGYHLQFLDVPYTGEYVLNFHAWLAYYPFSLEKLIRGTLKEGEDEEAVMEEHIQSLENATKLGDYLSFYRDMNIMCSNRRVFATESGLYGVGPKEMCIGDLCAWIAGISTPMVLRRLPNVEGKRYFKVIGEAHLGHKPYFPGVEISLSDFPTDTQEQSEEAYKLHLI